MQMSFVRNAPRCCMICATVLATPGRGMLKAGVPQRRQISIAGPWAGFPRSARTVRSTIAFQACLALARHRSPQTYRRHSSRCLKHSRQSIQSRRNKQCCRCEWSACPSCWAGHGLSRGGRPATARPVEPRGSWCACTPCFLQFSHRHSLGGCVSPSRRGYV